MNSATVRGSHRLDMVNGRHRRRAASPLTALSVGPLGALKAFAILALAVSLGLIGTGGTYAFLNSSSNSPASTTLNAGTAALTIGTESLNWSQLAPGASVTGTFTIKNTGDVPLVLSPSIAAIATGLSTVNPFTISVANNACPTSGLPSAGTLNSTLAAHTTTQACLVVTLPSDALASAQGTNVAISATISGVQP